MLTPRLRSRSTTGRRVLVSSNAIGKSDRDRRIRKPGKNIFGSKGIVYLCRSNVEEMEACTMTPSSNGNCSCDCVNCGRSSICPTCDKLLQWSEPDFDGDIRTGNYIIRRCTMSVTGVMTTLYRAMTSNLEPISRHVSLDYAKLACENHARKMLGWEV